LSAGTRRAALVAVVFREDRAPQPSGAETLAVSVEEGHFRVANSLLDSQVVAVQAGARVQVRLQPAPAVSPSSPANH
jgi:hypothetical protein